MPYFAYFNLRLFFRIGITCLFSQSSPNQKNKAGFFNPALFFTQNIFNSIYWLYQTFRFYSSSSLTRTLWSIKLGRTNAAADEEFLPSLKRAR